MMNYFSDPSKWNEEVKSMDFGINNPNVYHKLNPGIAYSGEILHKDEENRYCVQQIAPKSLAIHDGKKFERLPEKGDVVKIAYKDGVGKASSVVQRPNKRSRAQSIGGRGHVM